MSRQQEPPHSLETEISIIYACLVDGNALLEIVEQLNPDDFYSDKHKHIINSIVHLFNEGRPINLLTVMDYLRENGKMEASGGSLYLPEILSMETPPSTVAVDSYLEIVVKLAKYRKIKNIGDMLSNLSVNTFGTMDLIEQAELALLNISSLNLKKSGIAIADTLIDKTREMLFDDRDITGIAYPLDWLNWKTRGLQRGELVILAARPSVGKTALALNLIEHSSIKNGLKSVFFSLEMSGESLLQRMIAGLSGVSSFEAHKYKERVEHAFSEIYNKKIWIDDVASMTPTEIFSKSKKLKFQHGIDLIIVDYLQLMSHPDHRMNREGQISDISRILKLIARDLDVPVVCLSQLSRASEKRTDGKPKLSDLRDSGAIEQNADVVMFLHREANFDESPNLAVETELILAKNRNGPVGACKLMYHRETLKFYMQQEDENERR